MVFLSWHSDEMSVFMAWAEPPAQPQGLLTSEAVWHTPGCCWVRGQIQCSLNLVTAFP